MIKLIVSVVLLVIGQTLAANEIDPVAPQQVRLSFGESETELVITWSTVKETDSLLKFGIQKLDQSQKGSAKKFKIKNKIQYIHRVTLSHLKPNTRYIYSCGNDKAWSKQFHFHTPAIDSKDWVPSVAIFGDMSTGSAKVLPLLINDTKKDMYDAIMHIGDIGYPLSDSFMRKVEAVAAYVPYMTCAGNHESSTKYYSNFSDYRQRFSMPGDTEGLYYSFDLGPIHFIAVHTEVYHYFDKNYYQARHVLYQYQWLERDLQEANKPENRAKHPWIIVYGHRPMYCSYKGGNDCRAPFPTFLRKGIPALKIYGLEDLLYSYGVDIAFWGHEHHYERILPVYDSKVFNGSFAEPYRNPGAPVHIITGAGGFFPLDDFIHKNRTEEWSACRVKKYSFTRVKSYNATHLYLEQVTNKNKIIESFWIIKEKHGAYA